MQIIAVSTVLPGIGVGFFNGQFVNIGDALGVTDEFLTRNQFYGGQVGIRAEARCGRWYLLTRSTVALGSTQQQIDVRGSSTLTTTAGTIQTVNGGLLATATNIGTFNRSEFSVIPEVGVNIGYCIAPGLRVFVGYNFLYWNNVVRPGDQIDRFVNPNFVPTDPRFGLGNGLVAPRLPARTTDFFAHGINAGVAIRF